MSRETPDGEPVKIISLFVIPKKHSDLYLRIIALLATSFSDPAVLEPLVRSIPLTHLHHRPTDVRLVSEPRTESRRPDTDRTPTTTSLTERDSDDEQPGQ